LALGIAVGASLRRHGVIRGRDRDDARRADEAEELVEDRGDGRLVGVGRDVLDDVVDADQERHELGSERLDCWQLLLDDVTGREAVDREVRDEPQSAAVWADPRDELVRPSLRGAGSGGTDRVAVPQGDEPDLGSGHARVERGRAARVASTLARTSRTAPTKASGRSSASMCAVPGQTTS